MPLERKSAIILPFLIDEKVNSREGAVCCQPRQVASEYALQPKLGVYGSYGFEGADQQLAIRYRGLLP